MVARLRDQLAESLIDGSSKFVTVIASAEGSTAKVRCEVLESGFLDRCRIGETRDNGDVGNGFGNLWEPELVLSPIIVPVEF